MNYKLSRINNAWKSSNVFGKICMLLFFPYITFFIGFVEYWDVNRTYIDPTISIEDQRNKRIDYLLKRKFLN